MAAFHPGWSAGGVPAKGVSSSDYSRPNTICCIRIVGGNE